MLFNFVILSSGILIASFSLTFIILYLNLITLGYSFINYVNYIFRRWECLLIFVGVILIVVSLKKGK